MKTIIVLITIWISLLAIWGFNGYKLTQCDFQSDYRCEIIHGIGIVVPPSSLITVFFDVDLEVSE